jgi:hypothetical protein
MAVATLTALGLRQGDLLSWELEDGPVRVRAVASLDVALMQVFAGLRVPSTSLR